MKVLTLIAAVCVIGLTLAVGSHAQSDRSKIEISKPKDYRQVELKASPKLKEIVAEAVEAARNESTKEIFKPEEFAVTVIDLSDADNINVADVNGEAQFYSASVVKMYYMAALLRQVEDGKIAMTPELERGLRDMIVDSSNEATQYVLDVLTDTSSGGEKPQKEFEQWQFQRNRVNRWMSSMGYKNINVNQKTFCEDAYGIEQQSRGYKGQNRNMLTTNATARLLAEIVLGRANTPERNKQMMALMHREPFAEKDDGQAKKYAGKALIDRDLRDAKLWSKAGWTSKARHDVAYIETSNGVKFVIAVLTENHAQNNDFIGSVTGHVLDRLIDQKQEKK